MKKHLKPNNAVSGVEQTREDARRIIAFIAIGGFLGIMAVVVLIGMILKQPVDDTLKILVFVAATLGGIVGAITGFYYHAES